MGLLAAIGRLSLRATLKGPPYFSFHSYGALIGFTFSWIGLFKLQLVPRGVMIAVCTPIIIVTFVLMIIGVRRLDDIYEAGSRRWAEITAGVLALLPIPIFVLGFAFA